MGEWSGWSVGLFIWFCPFAASCCVIYPGDDGKIVRALDEHDFRSLMLLTGSVSSVFATLRNAPASSLEGMLLALQVLLVNWTLDLLVLVPLLASEKAELSWESWFSAVPTWFREIGRNYVFFAAICLVAGANAAAILQTKQKVKK